MTKVNYSSDICKYVYTRVLYTFAVVKLIAVPILIMLLIVQTFSKGFVMLSFELNQSYIEKNICENRFKPQLRCHGKCALMKKMKQEEKQEHNGNIKFETFSLVISSKSFFATLEPVLENISAIHNSPVNTGKPVDRAFCIFHPPSA